MRRCPRQSAMTVQSSRADSSPTALRGTDSAHGCTLSLATDATSTSRLFTSPVAFPSPREARAAAARLALEADVPAAYERAFQDLLKRDQGGYIQFGDFSAADAAVLGDLQQDEEAPNSNEEETLDAEGSVRKEVRAAFGHAGRWMKWTYPHAEKVGEAKGTSSGSQAAFERAELAPTIAHIGILLVQRDPRFSALLSPLSFRSRSNTLIRRRLSPCLRRSSTERSAMPASPVARLQFRTASSTSSSRTKKNVAWRNCVRRKRRSGARNSDRRIAKPESTGRRRLSGPSSMKSSSLFESELSCSLDPLSTSRMEQTVVSVCQAPADSAQSMQPGRVPQCLCTAMDRERLAAQIRVYDRDGRELCVASLGAGTRWPSRD